MRLLRIASTDHALCTDGEGAILDGRFDKLWKGTAHPEGGSGNSPCIYTVAMSGCSSLVKAAARTTDLQATP